MPAITITEALVELKLLANRITKETGSGNFITSYKIGNAPAGYSSVEAFEAKAKSSYQSILGLIERRNKIKAAIVASNATVSVTIATRTYTVAEAIERKNSIAYEQALLSTLARQCMNIGQTAERANQQAQQKLDQMLETSLGKEKSNPESIKPISDNFWSVNLTNISDPLSLLEKIESLRNSIDSFLAEVDTRLTISNSTTTVEV